MANQFPIQLANVGTRLAQARTPHINPDAGEMALANVLKSGADLFAFIKRQQDAAKLSQRKREFDEMSNDAFNIYSQTGDPEARRAIIDKWQRDADSLSDESGWVNADLQEYKNSQIPQWSRNFARQEVNHRIRQVDTDTQINMARHLELGDEKGYRGDVQTRVDMGLDTQLEAEQRLADFRADSFYVNAKKGIIATITDPETGEIDKGKGYDYLDAAYKNGLLDADQVKSLGDWLDNYVSGRERERDKANSAAYDTIAQMAIDEKSPEEVEAAINGMNITPQAKIDLKNSWLAATKTWNDTGINPYTQTQDYAKLVKLVHRIEDPEDSINLGDIDAEVNSGKDGAPVISFNDRQMLKNMLEERNKPAATGYSRTHPLAEMYIGVLDRLYDIDNIEEWSREKGREYTADRFAIEEALKENWGNEPAIEKAVAPILDKKKEEEAKRSIVKWLAERLKWTHTGLPFGPSPAGSNIMFPITEDERLAVPSGEEYYWQGKRYRKK